MGSLTPNGGANLILGKDFVDNWMKRRGMEECGGAQRGTEGCVEGCGGVRGGVWRGTEGCLSMVTIGCPQQP